MAEALRIQDTPDRVFCVIESVLTQSACHSSSVTDRWQRQRERGGGGEDRHTEREEGGGGS